MLSGIDRERLADELHELRLALAAAGEQDGEFTRDCIALGLKRIAGLLPEDCELLADRSAVDRVRRITHFCEELAEIIDGETSVDVTFPDLARRCWQLSRGLRERPTIDAAPETALRHGPDFRSVALGDKEYSFTPSQAASVKVLWEARENRTPDVGEQHILEAVESCGARLRDIFPKHPAWGTLIVPGKTKGTFRLAE